jgi:hypothetical protein
MKKILQISVALLIGMVFITGCGNHENTVPKAETSTKAAVTASSGGGVTVTESGVSAATESVEEKTIENLDKTEYHCTLSISCSTILDNPDKFDQAKMEALPKDGVIYKTKKVVFYEGESVFDVLLRETKDNKIHMEFVETPIYNSNYIEGINNIYEFDCGELSGWMYKVNDWFPNYGCSRYQLKDEDEIEWVYTCDLGKDVGGDWNAQKDEGDTGNK